MLAKNVNDNACLRNERGAFEFFASKLAPTEGKLPQLICDALELLLLLRDPHQLRIRIDVMPAAFVFIEQRPDKPQPHAQP